jgi:hypothetical protein
MPFGGHKGTVLPEWYLAKCPTVVEDHRGEIRVPTYDTPEYLAKWGAFVREAGRRYDGHPNLESVDVANIGPCGEGAGQCRIERYRDFAQLWKDAFPRTHRLALPAGPQFQAAFPTGAGWRVDCYGDMSEFGSAFVNQSVSWNHTFDEYPRDICKADGQRVWTKAPIHLETCWVPMHWYQREWDIDFILEQGLKYHATYFMPKYTRLPEKWMDKLAAFCRKLGYRFVLRQGLFENHPKRGGSFRFQSWIENIGVAPIYRPYQFALRLRQGDHAEILPQPQEDIRQWLPGDVWLDFPVTVPASFQPGYVELAAGIIDPQTQKVKVKFAVKEQFPDGWALLDGLVIE